MEYRSIEDVRESLDKACESLGVSDSILFIVESELLQDVIVEVSQDMLSRDKYGIYVSLNKPHKAIESMLKRSSIDTRRMYFIDCVTSLVPEAEKSSDCGGGVIHVLGPHEICAGGAISTAINKFLDSIAGEKFLIIDALRTLLIYNEPDEVSSFIHSLLTLTSSKDLKVVVMTHEGDEKIVSLIGKAFDEVVRL